MLRFFLICLFVLGNLLLPSSSWGEGGSYTISVEGRENVELSGSVSLYWFAWGALEEIDIGEIRRNNLSVFPPIENLEASIRSAYALTPENSADEVNLASSSVLGWFLIMELAGVKSTDGPVFYRSEDVLIATDSGEIDMESLLSQVSQGVEPTLQAMAGTAQRVYNTKTLEFPPIGPRPVSFRDLQGNPVPDLNVSLAVFGTNQNHCGRHQGIELGSFKTDPDGQVVLHQPRKTPLYYYGKHYVKAGVHGGIERYNSQSGSRVGEDDSVSARWTFTPRAFEINVTDRQKAPVAGADLVGCMRTSGKANQCFSLGFCGASCGVFGTSDRNGVLRFSENPSTICLRGIAVDSGKPVPISEPLLQELYGQGRATISLPID